MVAGAHEESAAAAEQATQTLQSGAVPTETPGSGAAVGERLGASGVAWAERGAGAY